MSRRDASRISDRATSGSSCASWTGVLSVGEDHSRKNDGRVPPDDSRSVGARLVSPSDAATYLGLGSRFAIYRLVASGQLRAVRIANKLRLDLRDIDVFIDEAKEQKGGASDLPGVGRTRPKAVPRELASRRLRG